MKSCSAASPTQSPKYCLSFTQSTKCQFLSFIAKRNNKHTASPRTNPDKTKSTTYTFVEDNSFSNKSLDAIRKINAAAIMPKTTRRSTTPFKRCTLVPHINIKSTIYILITKYNGIKRQASG